jgi:hypothetical protein
MPHPLALKKKGDLLPIDGNTKNKDENNKDKDKT